MTAKMRGGIVKRGSRWAFKVELAPDPRTGVRRQKWHSGYRTRKQAEAARDVERANIRAGRYVEATRETVAQYLTVWLSGMRGEYAPGTHDAAQLHVDSYIVPHIGHVALQRLTTPIVKAMYAELAESGRIRGGGPLAAKTVHNIHRTLSRALNDAVAEQPPRIPANPAARAHKMPPSPEQATWTAEQLRTFYAAVARDRLAALWRLAPSSGLRRGELAGLRWPDVDLDAGALKLIVQRAKGGGTVTARQLKGKRGRHVALDPATVAALKTWRAAQTAERLAWPGQWGNDDDLVFTHEDGSPLYPDSITKTLRRHVKAAGLPWVKLHGMRHTHATIMLEAGVPLKIVQERLGHASIAITGDVYAHVTPGMQADAAARVAAIVDGVAEK